MNILGIILARAGSKGLPSKCMRDLCGRPVIAYTFDHALASWRLTDVVFSTDSAEAKVFAGQCGVAVIDRPAELATDTATVDDAAQHAVLTWEARRDGGIVDLVVLLYGNIPVRRAGSIDEAIEKLIATGASSVRSVAPVTKQHPDWIHRLDGDRMIQFRKNSIYRRQDLEPFYYHDGAVVIVTRAALFGALDTPDDKQSFLGSDRRAIVCSPEDAVDIDGPVDLAFAEAVMLQSRDREGAGPVGKHEGTQTRRHEANTELRVTSYELRNGARVLLGGFAVGSGNPAFIIAEAGVNHDGNVETALRMVDAAKQAGADAVKFQMFRAAELASAQAETASYQKTHGGHSQRTMLANLELSDHDFARIAAKCDGLGIAFIVTPFGTGDVERLAALRTSNFALRTSQAKVSPLATIKIASTDLTNRPLLSAAIATGLPLIVSTGASTEEEIRSAVEFIRQHGAVDRLVLLHCVSAYPTPLDAMNLGAIAALTRAFGVPVGLSDHSTSTVTGAWAVAAGACLLEKHFTLDRSRPGPDHAMSLAPQELAEYVAQVRSVESTIGGGRIGMHECEHEVRQVARKSVVAAVPISVGTPIAADMLTLKRPGTGIPAGDLAGVIGKVATVAIPADTLLSWAMMR